MKSRGLRRVLWIACAILGILTLGAVVVFPSWIRTVEERRWAAMGRQIDDLEARLRLPKPARVLLRGTPVPGNAWDDYGGLLASLGEYKDYSRTADYAVRLRGEDKEEARTRVAECPTLADTLRRGAFKADVRLPAGFWSRRAEWLKVDTVIVLAIAQASFWEEEGRGLEAADLLVDAAQFALDLTGDSDWLGRYRGLYWLQLIMQGLARLVTGNQLPSDSRRELSRILRLLDQSLPVWDLDVAGLVETGRALQAAGTVERFLDRMEIKERDGSLRWYGNSDRLALVDFFDQRLQSAEEVAPRASRPWTEVLEASRRPKIPMPIRNPIVRAYAAIQQSLSAGDSPDDLLRQAQVRIRLVRAALGYLETGVVSDLDDPFGTKIRWSRSGVRLTLWSLGRDGVDNGGVGDWQDREQGKDIVLHLPEQK